MPPGRYTVCNEDKKGVRKWDGTGYLVWGPQGECGSESTLEEARDLAWVQWKVSRGRDRLVIRDNETFGAIVCEIKRYPRIRSWCWEVGERLIKLQSITARRTGKALRWFSARWTVSHTLTLVTMGIALLGIYLAFMKPAMCAENHENRCRCGTADGWQVCRGGKYEPCSCAKP